MPRGERRRAALMFGCGFGLGLLPWLWHVSMHYDAWHAQFYDHFRGAYAGGRAKVHERSFPLHNLVRHFCEVGDSPHVALTVLLGLVGSALFARRARLPLLLFAASALIGLLPGETFVKMMVAFLYAGSAAGCACAFRSLESKQRTFAWLLATLLLAPSVVLHGRLIARRLSTGKVSSERPIAALIARFIPRGAVVAGHPIAYFALKEHGAEQLYPNAFHGLRFIRTAADDAAHDAFLLRKRPHFLVLDDGMEPDAVGQLAQHATFVKLGSAKSVKAKGFTARDKYEVALYRVDYRAPPEAP